MCQRPMNSHLLMEILQWHVERQTILAITYTSWLFIAEKNSPSARGPAIAVCSAVFIYEIVGCQIHVLCIKGSVCSEASICKFIIARV
jgi:hypothetical protein